MGFPTRACMELTSDEAMKQSLRLVKDVSLSMSWRTESLPGERRHTDTCQDACSCEIHLIARIYSRAGKL